MVLDQSTKRLLIVFGVLILVYGGIQGYRIMDRKSQEKKFHTMMAKVYENNPGLKEEMAQREEMLRQYGPRALEPGFRPEAEEQVNSSRTTTKLEDGSEKVVVSFLSGKPREEYFMKDSHLEGPYKKWNEEGVLLEEVEYKNDKYDGLYKTYYASGPLKSEVTYVDGIKQGFSKNWLENERLSNEIEFDNDKIVSSTSYYPNNAIRMKEVLDTATGLLKTEGWYQNGTLSHQFYTKAGKREGKLIKNTPTGIMVAEASYKDGKYDGWCRVVNEKGDFEVELYYQDGIIDTEKSKAGKSCEVDIWGFGFR